MGDAGHTVRIDALYAAARRDRAAFDPPDNPPDVDRAQRFLRDGVAQALAVYVEARSGEWVRFEPDEFARLERAMNAWLECYAGCYGVEMEADFTLRTAAEALLDTHDITAVARVLTKVPGGENPGRADA